MVWGQMGIKKKSRVDNMFPAPAMCRLGDCPRVAFLCVCVSCLQLVVDNNFPGAIMCRQTGISYSP